MRGKVIDVYDGCLEPGDTVTLQFPVRENYRQDRVPLKRVTLKLRWILPGCTRRVRVFSKIMPRLPSGIKGLPNKVSK